MPDEKSIPSDVVPQLVDTSISLDSSPDSKSQAYAASRTPNLPQIPGYELLELLGEGGMGIVYKARHLKLNRFVAVKLLRNAEYASDEALKRFFTEAQINAELKHSNLVDVYDYGEVGRIPYLVMEYLEKKSLVEQLKINRRLKARTAARVVEKIARGVHAAHEKGIIHRDLKPGNILFTASGEPKVADFGLARRSSSDLTRSQAIMGTPYYMSPEQAKGQSKLVGPQADVWALGIILYECTTGVRPFTSEDPISMLLRIVSDEPEPMRSLDANIPWELEAVVQKCLAKSPDHRYANAGELADALAFVHADASIIPLQSAGAVTTVYPSKRKSSSAKWLAISTLIVALLGAIGTAGWFWKLAQDAKALAAKAPEITPEPAPVPAPAPPQMKPAIEPLPIAKVETAAIKPVDPPPMPVANQPAPAVKPAEPLPIKLPPEEKPTPKDVANPNPFISSPMGTNKVPDPAPAPLTKVDVAPSAKIATPDKVEPPIPTEPPKTSAKPVRPDVPNRATGQPTTVPMDTIKPPLRPFVPNLPTDFPNTARPQHDWSKLFVFRGHTKTVTSMGLSHDAAMLVTCSEDQTARIWSAKTGKLLFLLTGHRDAVNSANFNFDASRVVTASSDGTVKVWNANTGSIHQTIAVNNSGVLNASFSPDGQKLLIVESDRNHARVWHIAQGKYTLDLRGHTDFVLSASYSSDGNRILTTGEDETARVWNAQTGQLLFTFTGHADYVNWGFFATDNATHAITACDDHLLKMWDSRTGQQFLSLEGKGSNFVFSAYNQDTKRLFVVREDKQFEVWEPFNSRLMYSTMVKDVGKVGSIWSQADTMQLATFTSLNTVTLWDVGTLSRAFLSKKFAAPAPAKPEVENPFKK